MFSSELKSKNKIQTINVFAVPVLRYGCGILNWTQAEVSKLYVTTRKALSIAGMHHPTADIDQLCVWCSEGRPGLLNLVDVWKTIIVSLANYFAIVSASDPFPCAVKSFQK